ncbi:MAG: CAP domain-containing protein [Anaerolineales bacterium]|nr:CAP domain-containing protein [Anaerolineales bacterium]
MSNFPIQLARAVMLLVVLFGTIIAPTADAHAQSADQAADLAARLNRERVTRGLAPLALNAKLTTAAQAHAEDLARRGKINSAQEGHIGSDGSTVFDRVARTEYGAYSWGRRLGENWAWYRSAADALAMWMESAPHRANILHQLYREMGIGVASNPVSGFVYVVDFGVQPNVLPIFINDGASETKSPSVQITLTSEEVMPNGDGDSIGRPVQVMLANSVDFAGAPWQLYVPKITWTLAPNGGTKTVYVKYRDAKGRTALASDSIVVAAPTVPTSTPTRATPTNSPTRVTPRSSASVTFAPTERPPEIPTLTPTVVLTDRAPNETPTASSVAAVRATETRAPAMEARETNFDGLGMVVVAVMSIVLIRVWYSVER